MTNTPGRRYTVEIETMTNDQLNAFLETLANLIEAKAATPQDAAQIVRDAKTK